MTVRWIAAISASAAGQGAVFLPEAADRRFAGTEGLRLGVIPAHHDNPGVLVVVAYSALDQPADAAILHRDIAGGSDQIALPEAPFGHHLVVILEAQMDPFELGLFEPARADDANRNRIADLLQHHAWEDGEDLHRNAVAIFVDRFDNRAVLETEPAVRPQRRLSVIGVLLRVIKFRVAKVMRPAVVHDDPALLAQAVDPEGSQKQMQDAGMVGVLDVLGIELPVVGQYLSAAAENAGRPVQHAADAGGNFWPEIGFEIGGVVAKRPENQAGEFGDPQPVQIVLVLAKLGGHAALPLDPALERDAGQFPGQVIGP